MIKARAASTQTFVVDWRRFWGRVFADEARRASRGYGGLIINGKVGSDGGMKLVDRRYPRLIRCFLKHNHTEDSEHA